MKNILHIISSPRKDESFSVKLGESIITKLQAVYPVSQVKLRNLATAPVAHLCQDHLTAFFTRPENRTTEHLDHLRLSEEAISEIFEADYLVIGVPIYNFNMHSALKAWIDQIVRIGRTVSFTEKGPQGLIQHKKVYLAICSKGIYSTPAMRKYDFVEPYLKHILSYIGITDIEVIRLEGFNTPAEQSAELEKMMGCFSIV